MIVTVTKFETVASGKVLDVALESVDVLRCSEDAALGNEKRIGTVDILKQLFGVS